MAKSSCLLAKMATLAQSAKCGEYESFLSALAVRSLSVSHSFILSLSHSATLFGTGTEEDEDEEDSCR